jgi:hypothetical protein
VDQLIQTSDAAEAPQANVEVPAGDVGIDVGTGTEGNLFPDGGGESITNVEGLPTGQTAPIGSTVTPLEETSAPLETEAPVKEDPSRMQYWQSQTDKAKNENMRLRQELEYQNNVLSPIAEIIQKNPQVLNNIENLNNGNPSNVPQGQQQRNSLDKPVRPEKPHSYNEVDAYNDPESDSFKHRMANDQWRDDMIGWYERVDVARQQHQQAVAQEQQKYQMMQNAHSYAMNQHGLDANSANDFVRWAQNPANITVDSLVKLYTMAKAPQQQQQSQVQRKAEDMRTQQERLKVPRPTTIQPGESAPVLSQEDEFNQALLNKKRR